MLRAGTHIIMIIIIGCPLKQLPIPMRFDMAIEFYLTFYCFNVHICIICFHFDFSHVICPTDHLECHHHHLPHCHRQLRRECSQDCRANCCHSGSVDSCQSFVAKVKTSCSKWGDGSEVHLPQIQTYDLLARPLLQAL